MMRKVEFAWLLPACMVLIIGLVGVVLYKSLDWLQTPQPEVALSGEGLTYPHNYQQSTQRPSLSAAEAIAVATGETLFKGNCAQCHAVNDVVVGPALGGITKRRPISWLIPWVKNSSKVIASGDEYAGKIFNQYQQQMPSFQLSAAEIKDIVAYIEAESQAGRANSPLGVVAICD